MAYKRLVKSAISNKFSKFNTTKLVSFLKTEVWLQAVVGAFILDSVQSVRKGYNNNFISGFRTTLDNTGKFLKAVVSPQRTIEERAQFLRAALGRTINFAIILYLIKNRKTLKISTFWLVVIIGYFAIDLLSG